MAFLSGSLLITIACFFAVTIFHNKLSSLACKIFGMSLHTSVLMSFGWMMVQAVLVYKNLVIVFVSANNFLWKCSVPVIRKLQLVKAKCMPRKWRVCARMCLGAVVLSLTPCVKPFSKCTFKYSPNFSNNLWRFFFFTFHVAIIKFSILCSRLIRSANVLNDNRSRAGLHH